MPDVLSFNQFQLSGILNDTQVQSYDLQIEAVDIANGTINSFTLNIIDENKAQPLLF